MKIDKILDIAYENEENQIYQEDLHSDPHGEHWSTSFHASDPRDCPRKSIYTLLNVPSPGPITRQGRAIMEAGKAVEESIVWRFYRAGILLSEPPDSELQGVIEDADSWLTCSFDAIIKMPDDRAHPVEIKSKSEAHVQEMKKGERSFDEPHMIQLLTQIGMLSDQDYPKPTTDGTILYVSRDSPSNTHEFRFQHNEEMWLEEKTKLIEWTELFREGKLPDRPKEFKWSEYPCKYCPYKKHVCKPDFQRDIVDLEKSHAISWAKKIRKDYNYEEQRTSVLKRWNQHSM